MKTQFANTEWDWERAGEWIRTKFDGRRGGWAVARLEWDNPDYEKNARLILAAPYMLDALELIERNSTKADWADDIWTALVTAINKARGDA